MKKIIKWGILIILCVVFILGSNVALCNAYAREIPSTAQEVVSDMGMGWNLGKNLESYNASAGYVADALFYETLWNNPKTTQKMIKTVKEAGFGAVRIPVTYLNHIDEDGKIDETWLHRVAEIVDYVIENNMYAIINVHHDTGKREDVPLQANYNNLKKNKALAQEMWEQIADYFKGYDRHLFFESYNEMLDMDATNPWYGNPTSWAAMNEMNQLFVDTVRKTGGNNATRFLVVNTYGAQTNSGILSYFKLPTDTIANHLIVGVHTYVVSTDGIQTVMQHLDSTLLSKGYACIIGEWAISGATDSSISTAEKMLTACTERKIACFWWDDGGNYKLLNRSQGEWYYPQLVDDMIKIVQKKEETEEIEENNTEKETNQDISNEGPFKQLTYIEVPRTGCAFKTDIPISSEISIELKAATIGNYYGNLLQAGSGSSKLMIRQEAEKGIYCAYGWYNSVVTKPETYETFVIYQEKNLTYINGKLVRKATAQTFSYSDNITLGAAPCRIYECKIWNADKQLLRDYVPAYDENGKVCFYEKIEGNYLYSNGSCIAGIGQTQENIEEELEGETNEVEKKAYIELEYIEIPTAQNGFKTGATLASDMQIELTAARTGYYYGNLLQAGSSSSKLLFRQEAQKGIYCAYGWYNSVVATPKLEEKFVLLEKSNETYYNGTLVRKATAQTFSSSDYISIGTSPCKIYGCRIWDGKGNLLHEYVPAYDEQNKVCLYDKINDIFIYASGTCIPGKVKN